MHIILLHFDQNAMQFVGVQREKIHKTSKKKEKKNI